MFYEEKEQTKRCVGKASQFGWCTSRARGQFHSRRIGSHAPQVIHRPASLQASSFIVLMTCFTTGYEGINRAPSQAITGALH